MIDKRTMALCAIVTMMGSTVSACSGGASDAEAQSDLEVLQEKYPRIPAGDIELSSQADLKSPDFDVGGHCLAEEEAGHGSFEECLEVVSRELVAIGGPD